MKKETAMQQLVNELEQTIKNPENALLNDGMIDGLRSVLILIKTDFFGDSLLLKEKQQIIEAAKNFSNNPGEAENYFNITYNQPNH
jgi:hypothetical protein